MTVPNNCSNTTFPGSFGVNVAKSDTVAIATTVNPTRGVWVGGAGDLCVKFARDSSLDFWADPSTDFCTTATTRTVGTFNATSDVDDTTETITMAAHGMVNGSVVKLTVASGVILTGLAVTTYYYVVGATTNTFQLSATLSGSAVNVTAAVGTNTVTEHVTASHNWTNGQIVVLTTVTTLPTGLSATTLYYVVSATASTFKLSATLGGSAIDITAAGTGVHTAAPVALYSAVAAGTWMPLRVSHIYSTGTTATLYTPTW